MEKLFYGIVSFLVFVVAIYIIPVILCIIDSRREKRKELEQDIKDQENWFKSVQE